MKCITPNPELPFSDLNMLSYNGLPSRPQRTQMRNMTGIYLGHDENTNNKSKKNTIPPLARGRGMTCRQKTPVERRRYQRVESLRSRDEHRGFNPMPIKKAKPRTVTTWKTDDRAQSPSKGSRSPSEFCSLPKKTGRNYVAVANSGYTHLESLGSPHGWNRSEGEGNITSSMMEEIRPEDNLSSLEDCYRKICKQSNMPGIQSLLPHLKASVTTKTKGVNTPLTIRSFRNPQNPHPVIQYSDPQARPQTLPSSACRPAVPAPYYYSSKNLPKTAEESGSRVRLQRVQGSGKNRDKILAAPGVGSLTRSANRKRGTPVDPPSCIEGTPPPTNPNQAKFMDDPGDYYRELRVPSGTPATSATNLAKLGTNRSAVSFNSDDIVASDLPAGNEVDRTIPGFDSNIQQSRSSPASDSSLDADILEAANLNNSNNLNIGNLTLTEKENSEQIVSGEGDEATKYQSNGDQLSDQKIAMDTEHMKLEEREEGGNDGSVRDSSGPNIIISVQDDEGHSKMLNIQEEDFTQGTTVTKKRPLLRFSQIAEAVREASKRKQMEFQTLLEEHAELVSQIEEMEQKNKTGA